MNKLEIRKAYDVIKGEKKLVEIRVIAGNRTFSGYFTDYERLIQEVERFDDYQIYFVFNEINSACFSRMQANTIMTSKQTTSDNDIVNRDWILIDIDPERISGVSSNNEEKKEALSTIEKIYDFLKDIGFAEPVIADSGNGYHLLYKIALKNNQENTELVKNFLNVLDMLFSNEKAKVDISVFNPSRITKLYGTFARKGKSTEERPFRESKILKVPEEIKHTAKELIVKVADMLPKQEEPSFKNGYNPKNFNLQEFINKNNIQVKSVSTFASGKKYILENCIFDENHKAPDACIFELNNGSYGYKCFHNSCSQYTWKDVRKKFDSYHKKEESYRFRTNKPLGTTREQLLKNDFDIDIENDNDKKKKFLQLSEIEAVDRSKIVSIPSGFIELDKSIIGFNKGEVSVWSGSNASGKSSVLNQLALIAAEKGFKTAIYSGELTSQRMKMWLQLQAAGRQYTAQSQFNQNAYYVPSSIGNCIDKWLDNKLWVYNNDYGNNFEKVLADVKEKISSDNLDMIIIDNLMALDILTLNGDKYEKQSTLILALTDLAKKYNIHLHIVCHPRKSLGFLRKNDISGTADLTNAVDNVFIVHRVNQDFKRLAKDFYGEREIEPFYQYSNIIEICKNRDLGVSDKLIGLYFEIESKRLLNTKNENIVLGWKEILNKNNSNPLSFLDDSFFPF